jgi:hypothetical protein
VGETGFERVAPVAEIEEFLRLKTPLERVLQEPAKRGGVVHEDEPERGGGGRGHDGAEQRDVPPHCKTALGYVGLRNQRGELSP